MSIKAMSYIWEHSKQKGSKLLMLLAIADRCDDYGVCYPGHKRLAEKARISTQSVSKNIKELEKSGELSVIIHGGIKTTHGKTNKYYLKAYRDSLGLVTKDGNRSEYVTYDGVSKRIPQEVSNSIPQEVSNSIPYTSVDSSVDSSEKDLPPALSLDGDELSDFSKQLLTDNEAAKLESDAQWQVKQSDGGEPADVSKCARCGTEQSLQWIKREGYNGVVWICGNCNDWLRSLERGQDSTTADLAAPPALTITEADAAIYGTRDNPVTPTEHIGALCEVAEDAPPKAKKVTPHTAMKNALVAALGFEEDDITCWGDYNTASKKLRNANVPPEEVVALHAVSTSLARRGKYTFKSPMQLAKDLPEYRKQQRQQQARQQQQTDEQPQPLSATDGVVRGENE